MNRIEVIGLGAGDINQLSLGIYRKLTQTNQHVFVRTDDHPVIKTLEKEGVNFVPFDDIYQAHDQFEPVYQAIAQQLKKAAEKHGTIIYAVPGHPMLAERTVQLLLEIRDLDVEIIGGQSYLDDLFTVLKVDPIDGFQFLDATDFERSQIDYRHHLIFCQVYDQMVASDVKLTLLEDLPPEHLVTVVEAVGSEQERIETVSLVELDQGIRLSNLTSVYVHPTQKEELNHQFFRLRDVIAELRGPNGCPWDQKQTNESLRPYLIEETYELIEAINQEDDDGIIEELGDVLLQVMLHSQIGEDQGFYTIDDVILSIVNKMIRRHPHVFAHAKVNDVDDVLANWQEIKATEKKVNQVESILERVPTASAALVKAEALQKEASKVGFDWTTVEPIWDKIREELTEIKEAIKSSDGKALEGEFGDVLFAIVNLARYYKINSEVALERTNQKFIKRFQFIEQKVKEKDLNIEKLTLEALDRFWEEAKELE